MFCSVHNLFAMLSSPTPTDLSLYHYVDYLTYSTPVKGNSRDVLLRCVLVIERAQVKNCRAKRIQLRPSRSTLSGSRCAYHSSEASSCNTSFYDSNSVAVN